MTAPFEAFNLDRKVDDGRPMSGSVRPYVSRPLYFYDPVTPAVPAVGVCVSNVGNTYNQSTENFANEPSCEFLSFSM